MPTTSRLTGISHLTWLDSSTPNASIFESSDNLTGAGIAPVGKRQHTPSPPFYTWQKWPYPRKNKSTSGLLDRLLRDENPFRHIFFRAKDVRRKVKIRCIYHDASYVYGNDINSHATRARNPLSI
jgi:hypothetical protein